MASERDLELLEDYLANRMDSQSRAAFEQRVTNDAQLKSELQLQQQLISGIKQARVAELKNMLSNVPIPAGQTTGVVAGAKVAIWVTVAGLIATGVYLYSKKDSDQPSPSQETVAPLENKTPEKTTSDTANDAVTAPDEDSPVVSSQESASEHKPIAPPKPGKKSENLEPSKKIEVYDPSTELETNGEQEEGAADHATHVAPAIAVEIESENKKYTFHYQFKNGKLILYGPFEKGLYEILEFFNEDKRTLFLYYNENYYLLKDNSATLKPLNAIEDPQLLNKLKEYRNK